MNKLMLVMAGITVVLLANAASQLAVSIEKVLVINPTINTTTTHVNNTYSGGPNMWTDEGAYLQPNTSFADDIWVDDIHSQDWTNFSGTESQITDLQSYLLAEVDPYWTANQTDYYTSAQVDSGFVATEVDPYWTANQSDYYTSAQVDSGFVDAEVDPFWTANMSSYYTSSEVDAADSAQDACSEITGCVENALTAEVDPYWSANQSSYYTSAEVDSADSAQDACSEITGCVENALTVEVDPYWTANQSSYATLDSPTFTTAFTATGLVGDADVVDDITIDSTKWVNSSLGIKVGTWKIYENASGYLIIEEV